MLLEPEACVICGMSVGIVLLTIGLVVSFLTRFVAEATKKIKSSIELKEKKNLLTSNYWCIS